MPRPCAVGTTQIGQSETAASRSRQQQRQVTVIPESMSPEDSISAMTSRVAGEALARVRLDPKFEKLVQLREMNPSLGCIQWKPNGWDLKKVTPKVSLEALEF